MNLPNVAARAVVRGIALRSLLAVVLLPLAAEAPAQSNPKVVRLEQECLAQSGKACHDLAKVHRQGKEGLIRSAALATDYYQKACQLEVPAACHEFGEAMLNGWDGITLDTAKAIPMLERGCDLDPDGRSGGTFGVGGRRRCTSVVEHYGRLPQASIEDSVDLKAKYWRRVARACELGKVKEACPLRDLWRTFPDSIPDDRKKPTPEQIRAKFLEDSIAGARRLKEAERVTTPPPSPPPVPPPPTGRLTAEQIRQNKLRFDQMRGDCDAGSAQDCVDAARMSERGLVGARNRAEERRLRAKACQLDKSRCPRPRGQND